MKRFLMMMPVLSLLLSGCAVTTESGQLTRATCAFIGGTGGALIGAIDSSGAAGAGAVVGGLIGYFVCDEPDSDGDGVVDDLDQCPGTPAGVKVDEVGCPLDADGDGVPDYLDQCPNTPAGAPVDEVGCPLDSDGDGVPDYLDQCPGTPAGTKVDELGCPAAAAGPAAHIVDCGDAVMVEGNTVVGFADVLFAFDSSELTPEGRAVLDCVVDVVEHEAIDIALNGHTCSVGTEAYNMRLSQRRAHSSRDYLLSKGVAESKMSLNWFGEGAPAHDNGDLEVRRLNRRVEVAPQQ